MGDFISGLQSSLSVARLNGYRLTDDESDLDVLARYVWNMDIGGALYSSLHILEVGLRNRLDSAITHREGEMWFNDPDVVVDAKGRAEIDSAKRMLIADRKVVSHSRMVAALDFGFWTSLFKRVYEQGPSAQSAPNEPLLLSTPAGRPLWPQLLPATFPGKTRAILSGRFNELRQLRNRIFHHEPIWRGMPTGQGTKGIDRQHDDLIEAIGWIDADLRRAAVLLDTFPKLHGAGHRWYRAQLSLL